jgi:hypothetical protein
MGPKRGPKRGHSTFLGHPGAGEKVECPLFNFLFNSPASSSVQRGKRMCGSEMLGKGMGDKGMGDIGDQDRWSAAGTVFSFPCPFLRDRGTVRRTSERNGSSHRFDHRVRARKGTRKGDILLSWVTRLLAKK